MRRIPALTEHGVTSREADVLDALGKRLSNAEIAASLFVSERTVESHVSSLLRKLQASNRIELGEIARRVESGGTLRAPDLPAPLELLAGTSFVGRHAELTQLLDVWAHARAGRTLVALVSGEAGIGKSRLVAEFAVAVHHRSGRVLLGSCFEDVQLAYQPFVHALSDDLAGLPDGEVRRRVGNDGPALARVLPHQAERWDGRAPRQPLDIVAERAEIYDGLHGYLSRAAATSPLLLVLEDLHWAAGSTRAALRHLARVSGHAPLLIVATTRDTSPELDDALQAFLGDLVRYPSVETVQLSPLDDAEVDDLLAAIGASADATWVREHTGGNPLFVLEYGAGNAGRSAGSLHDLLTRRYQLLEREDGDVLDVAAIVGTEFGADLLAVALDGELSTVLEALEHAERAGLVAAMPGRPGRFGFVHALFRSARYDAIPTSRRMRLHQRVARALALRAGDSRVIPELARHACLAAPLGNVRDAVEYARRAGDLARTSLAFDDAAGHYRRALDVIDLLQPPDGATRDELTVQLGETLIGSADPEGRTILEHAATAARDAGNIEMIASIAWSLFVYAGQRGAPDPLVLSLVEEALAGMGPEPTRARARALMARAGYAAPGEDHRRREFWDEALAVARQLDDPTTTSHVLVGYQGPGWRPDNLQERVTAADELAAPGPTVG